MLTIASAHSKFILSGEHFVVDGAPSVVIPANCFSTQVRISDNEHSESRAVCIFDTDGQDWDGKKSEYEALILELIRRSSELMQIDLKGIGLSVTVRSSIPPAQGAGSSSALCQAISEAMLKHFIANEIHPHYLKWYGTQLETSWHGKVSGVDNAAVAYRRILFYQRGCAPQWIEPGCPLFFVAGTTGVRGAENPYQRIRWHRENQLTQFLAYRKVSVDNAIHLADAIRSGRVVDAGVAMNESHDLFHAMGIVTPKMHKAVLEARNLGAYGARMTGAGGGGFVIACAPIQAVESIQKCWMEMGLQSVRVMQFGNIPG